MRTRPSFIKEYYHQQVLPYCTAPVIAPPIAPNFALGIAPIPPANEPTIAPPAAPPNALPMVFFEKSRQLQAAPETC